MKKIENFRIVPTADKDGRQREGVCLVGMVDGIETQTSNITRIAPGGRVLLTEKGTKYELGELYQSLNRPKDQAKLRLLGF
jgi:hypothetical protein